MRLSIVFGLTVLLATPMQIAAGPRDSGSENTARHAERDDNRSRRGAGRRGPETVVVVPRQDPAVERFWSDRCVNQRRFGTTSTKDCDNPAYTGGRYRSYVDPYPRYVDPYPRYTPYGRGAYVPYPGGISIDRRGFRGSKTYGDRDKGYSRLPSGISR